MSHVLYIDSVGGLAGDMFLAAALDAGFVTLEELEGIVSRWLPEAVRLTSRQVERNLMRARTFEVEVGPEGEREHAAHGEQPPSHHGHHHPHRHRHLADVEHLLAHCPMSPAAIGIARTMFRALAEAEAKAHGIDVAEVHFHEVGATDSLVDFALAAYVIDKLGAAVEASPAIAGRGHVTMDHGLWPIPPPGTANVLQAGGIPIRAVPPSMPWENVELTTPTGACLLRLARRFGDVPEGRIVASGVGAGSLDIPGYPNVTRLFLVEAAEASTRPGLSSSRFDSDEVAVLETWIDDLPGNLLALAVDDMLKAGALDVAVSSATFKKGRVGYRVEALAPVDRAHAVAEVVLGRTTAIGLRIRTERRWKLFRREETTADGLAGKLVHDATGDIARVAPETDALADRAAREGRAPFLGWRVEDRRG